MSTIAVFDVSGKQTQELERIFKEYYQFVYRTAYGVTGSVEDAEDIVQNIFAGLLRRELPPDLQKNPKAYFYRAAFNLSMNTIRNRKRHPSSGNVEALKTIPCAPDSSVDEELDGRLHAAIAELHSSAAQVVILRYVHNQSLADIAKLLGTTRSTVAVTLFRARARLKKLLLNASEERGGPS